MASRMKSIQTPLTIMALAVVLGVGLLGYYLFVVGPQAGFVGEQAAPSGSGVSQLPNCGNQQPLVQFKAYYLDPNNNDQYSLVETQAAACTIGNPVCDVMLMTSDNATVSSTAGEISCGAKYRQIVGDQGDNYYFAVSKEFTVDNSVMLSPNKNKGLLVIPSGSATALVKSSTGNYGSSVTFNWTAAGLSNGSTDSSNLLFRVQSPAAPAMYGDLGYAICFRYNSSEVQDMRIGSKLVAINHVKATATDDTVRCYEQPVLNTGTVQQDLPIYVKGATDGPVNGSTVDVILVPKTNEFFNGYLIPTENAQAGVSSNGYDEINSPNDAIVGSGDIVYTDMITFTR